jgi:5'-AMP-activated protein kinase catalytic alpha subunit
MPVDMKIVKELAKIMPELSEERIKECIEANEHNNVTTSYYLLLKKCGNSSADINLGKLFDCNLVSPLTNGSNNNISSSNNNGGILKKDSQKNWVKKDFINKVIND